ncbi:WhiB family transcriptional regulator [Streptomyces sp. BI20]|uniref:WhiB family transcriptional regulator n=1 Tax=Streptomyces sp. BI20 TaxID=3403460 RepID=UPI003C7150B4
MDWRTRALCVTEDPDLFFPVGTSGPAVTQTSTAKEVCGPCPVVDRCLDWALRTHEPSGIWGGMTTLERRELIRAWG